jgi:hypothetical protein
VQIEQERLKMLIHRQVTIIKTLATQPGYAACADFTNRRGVNAGRGHALVHGVAVSPDLLDALELGERATDPLGLTNIKASISAITPKANAANNVPTKATTAAELARVRARAHAAGAAAEAADPRGRTKFPRTGTTF